MSPPDRRRVLRAGLAAALALPGMAPSLRAQSQFRGGPAHTGRLDAAAPATAPALRWRFATGGRVVASPVTDGTRVVVASDDGQVYALDPRSGRLLWQAATDGPVPSTPAIADGRVHVLSYDGRVHTLDAATGAPLWRFATGGERRFEARGLHGSRPRTQTVADPYDVFLSSPVVAGGTLWVGSSDGHLLALDAATGALRWRQRTGDVVHASPAVSDGIVVVGSWDGGLYAYDAADGTPRWRFQAGLDPLMHNQQGFQSSPAIEDGIVCCGCRDAHLYALDLRSGAERWRFSTGQSWVVGSPALAGGKVVFATSDTSLVHALDVASGRPAWQVQAEAYMFASPTVAGDTVLLGQLNGTLLALSLADGAERWRWRTAAAAANPGWALTAEGRLNAPWLYPSGWFDAMALGFERQNAAGGLFSSALAADGAVFVGSADGALYALG